MSSFVLLGSLDFNALMKWRAHMNQNPVNTSSLPLVGKRLAFLGDSITDGHTLPLLVEQSLQAAGLNPPRCTNVAVAGNKASDMLKRLDRDVIALRPDYLMLSAGINDACCKNVSLEAYAQTVNMILERLNGVGVKVIVMTTTPITGKSGLITRPFLDGYNIALHRLAAQYGCRVAEVNRDMRAALAGGDNPMGADGIHVNFSGYRVMTRSVLDALGYANVPVADQLKLTPMPGIVHAWKIRPAPSDNLLTPSEVALLQPDANWSVWILPEVTAADDWWLEQERQRGFAVGLESRIGKAKLYWGVAELDSSRERSAYLNTGAGLKTIWLNGKKVYQSPGDSGWHAGRERVPVVLCAGQNAIFIETEACFFLSVTEDNQW